MHTLQCFLFASFLLVTQLVIAQEEQPKYISISSQIFQTQNLLQLSFSDKLNNAELTAAPKLITHVGKPATIEMGTEGKEMLTMVITPNNEGSHVTVDLKLGMADNKGQWQQTTTSAIDKKVAESFLLTAELGGKTYIITINTEPLTRLEN